MTNPAPVNLKELRKVTTEEPLVPGCAVITIDELTACLDLIERWAKEIKTSGGEVYDLYPEAEAVLATLEGE